MPYMTLNEFLKYWVSFESYEKKITDFNCYFFLFVFIMINLK